MTTLGPIAFLEPWLLLALLLLPLLWLLLRATPPAPRRQLFPAIRLLLGLRPPEETPARTPWWLLLLRCLLIALAILAFARPILNPGSGLGEDGRPLLLVIDDGWSAARRWDAHRQALDDLLAEAERAGTPVRLLLTAPSADGAAPQPGPLLSAADARGQVQALEPKPWPSDRSAAAEALAGLPDGSQRVVWAADGLDDGGAELLGDRLAALGPTRLLVEPAGNAPRLLRPPVSDERALELMVQRADPVAEDVAVVVASRADGREVTRAVIDLPAGETEGFARLELPLELRNAIARLAIEGEATAGATLLLDARSARQPVGLVDDGGTAAAQPLLTELYYIERALQPFAAVVRGNLDQLLADPPSLLVVPDTVALDPGAQERLAQFVDNGGTLLRIAGPRLAAEPDPMLPVALRSGDRVLGGVMTWGQPARLAPFQAPSPFAGLTVPPDVEVSRQVLAEPSPELSDRTWARLTDGTPLVTAAPRGRGLLVLLHTTAGPDWSNLALSGLFVQMLERVLQAGSGIAAVGASESLPPIQTLDAFGRLEEPAPTVLSLTGAQLAAGQVGPLHPPGYYGGEQARVALNLEAAVPELVPLPALSALDRSDYQRSAELELKPWLLGIALLLALTDLVIALWLRGLLRPPARAGAAAAALLLAAALMPTGEARAQSDSYARLATLETRLAYVETGDATVDAISRAGLTGLSNVLTRRTSIEAAAPLGVNLGRDEIIFFPLLYWPVTPGQGGLDAAIARKVNDYLATGGTILFDLRDSGGAGQLSSARAALKEVTSGLRIPPLQPLPPEHVLTKAFYLMQEFPGRYAGGELWIDAVEQATNDGVATVVIGANDWAAAWAVGEDGRPLYAVVPGGERQRELAYRFGVNLVMYALTGNYKSDQVHVPYILERLGQ